MPKIRFYLAPEARAKGSPFEAPKDLDAGFDIRASENIVIDAKGQAIIPTGLKLSIPKGWVGIVKDRSSMASKRLYTHAGVIDAGYRGEVRIVMSNHGETNFHIEEGSKIAQMVVVPCLTDAEEVVAESELGATSRGVRGFGSTGK